MAINSSSIVSTLGAGSGIDIKALAESLVEAERKPFKDRIDEKIAKSEARISGYGAMRSYLEQLKASFEKLNEASDFGGLSQTNSQPVAFTATLGSAASTGSYDISVSQLASAQRTRSDGFASATADLNNGEPLTLQLTRGGVTRPITVASPATPQAIVDAINQDAAANGTGLSAELVRYSSGGTTYHAVEVQGRTGADQGFALAIDPASYRTDLLQQNPPQAPPPPPLLQKDTLQEAADARLRVNGQTYTRTSNTLTDVISNLTLELTATTTTTARLAVTRDVQSVKDNIKGLVASYNDFQAALKELSDSKSEVETLGGALAGDRLLQSIRNQMRTLVGSGSGNSAVNALRDLGISVDLTGRMTVQSEVKLDAALRNNFSDAVRMFSSNPSSTTGKGLAGDALAAIESMVSTKSFAKGTIQKQIDSVNRDVTRYKADLTKLEARLEKSLERYMNQFSAMESMVGNSNSVRAGLKSTFEGMMNSSG